MTMNSGRHPASQPKVKLLELWERKSGRTGKTYMTGFLGNLNVVAFAETRTHPKRPGEELTVWTLYASEGERRHGTD